MKLKTILLCLLLLILLSALAVIGGHFIFRKPPINKEAFERIKDGMTMQEVEAIVGPPTTRNEIDDPFHVYYWRGTGDGEGSILVFLRSGIVAAKEFINEHDPSHIDKIKKWLGLEVMPPSAIQPTGQQPW